MRPRSRPKGPLIRLLLYMLTTIFIIHYWRRNNGTWERFFCGGNAKPPPPLGSSEKSDISPPDLLTNPHDSVIVESPTINHVDLGKIKPPDSKDRVLIVTPLRDAAPYLEKYFKLLASLTYPHKAVDLAFLVGDCKDNTLETLRNELGSLQSDHNPSSFRSAMIVQKDFGDTLSQNVEERHSFKAQGTRRKGIGRSRNYLLYAALKPEHDWVYWRDVDIVEHPESILEDFMKHDRDVLVPNIWFHRYDKDGKDIEGRYDYNSWQESWWGRWLRRGLDKDTILAEGYKEFKTRRKYLNWMGDRHKDPHKEVRLDGIGGVNILVKADVHRSGINFPCYAFENQADTEGFAAMAKRAGYQVVGLPNYVVWHIDTEEKEGNLIKKSKEKAKES